MEKDRTYATKVFALALVFICLLFCLRVFHIDQDLPPWGVVTYQPIDEGQYAAPAINLQTFGAVNAQDTAQTGLKYPVFTEYSLRSNIVGNYLTMVGLQTLGDNYYGLRVPYVLIGLINLLLFAATLRTLQRAHGSEKQDVWVLLAFMVFLLVDFCFYVASRTVEPTSVRLLTVQLCTLVYLKMKDSARLRFLLLGVISVSSVFLIYITNTVLVLAMGLVLLSLWYRQGFKAFIKSTLWFILGALIGWGLGELYFRAVWGIGAIENTFSALSRFMVTSQLDPNYGAAGVGAGGILTLIKHVFRFFCSNYILYNLPVFCVYLMALPVLLMRCFDKKNGEHYALLLALPIAFLIQTIFFEDYIIRKFLILVPSLLGALYLLYLNRNTVFTPLPKWMRSRDVKTVWACAVTLAIILIAAYRVVLISDGSGQDFSRFDQVLVFAFGVFPAVAACAAWIRFNPNQTSAKRFLWRWGYVLGVSTILLNLGMSARHVWLNPTYSERDAMIQIADKVDHKYVFGVGYQLGFTLYNEMLPIVENPSVFCKYVLDTPDSYVLDIKEDDAGTRNQIDNTWFSGSDQSLKIAETLYRSFQTNGRVFDIALFELAPKMEIIQSYKDAYTLKQDAYAALVYEYNHTSNLSSEAEADYQRRIDAARQAMEEADVYPDVHANIYDDLTQNLYASVYGDIYGAIRAEIYGNVYGNIYGDIYVKPAGEIFGKVYGKILYSE